MELEQGQQRRFSHEEMSEIIELASRLDQDPIQPDSVSLTELRQIAAELGIDPAAVDAVVARQDEKRWEAEAEIELAEWRAERRARRWRHWRGALARTLVLIGGLWLFDLVSDGDLSWFYFPALFIGIAFVSRTLRTVFNTYESDQFPRDPES